MEIVHYSYGYIFKKTQKPFKCNNHANAKNSLCRKQWTVFMRKQWTVLINAKNRFYECSKQIRIYSKNDVQSANFINVETNFINAKNRFDHCKIQTWKSIQIWCLDLEKTISLGVLWENSDRFFK